MMTTPGSAFKNYSWGLRVSYGIPIINPRTTACKANRPTSVLLFLPLLLFSLLSFLWCSETNDLQQGYLGRAVLLEHGSEGIQNLEISMSYYYDIN